MDQKVITLSGLPTLSGLGALDLPTTGRYALLAGIGAGAGYLTLKGHLGLWPALAVGGAVGLAGAYLWGRFGA